MDTVMVSMDGNSGENAVAPTNEIGGISRPDPDGDVIFKFQDQSSNTTTSFRVSSKVLRLASPVFTRMFSPYFQEGQELLQGEHPVIELKDDDAQLMGIILSILHYQGSGENHVMSAERLARLAIHCDKYDCVNALGPWISVWFKNVERMSELSEEFGSEFSTIIWFGFMLLAAYMFNNPGKFTEISEAALRELPPGFFVKWEGHEILTILPASVPSGLKESAMTICIKRTLGKLEAELQSVETLLREYRRCYETSQLICVNCGRTLPEEAKKCHPCRNSLLPPKYCTSETRIAEYFAVLRKVELWPTAKPFEICSVSDIAFRFTCAKADLKHNCAADANCPLLTKKTMNGMRVGNVCTDS
ncbi:hypothetical protein K469DRAFT_738836 [Zopfia rhizophila CBS 207.26]|uniref:BTB domain-containing protein n=1 Tax=Zopfia rhizophila CBS 207.26 TaxID=1314779 RepID=A0A6A6E5P6_9PEZI|nr:hypothetical protein K469DRAFT_738836 [Zopfia rhizophila CBS 207.26]